ncbi:MAG: DUF4114 domain-containing protein [Chitinophagales bacterium]
MKLSTLIVALLFSIVANAQTFQYLGTYNSDGVPDYLLTPDVVDADLLTNIAASLPESFPVPDFNPQYIADSVETDILLTDDADVWVTFIDEGAGYKNVLGFYTYDIANPPTTAPTTENITIIFPNVSKNGSGGGLNTGDKVHLGSFTSGTGIGFVLIADGWDGSTYNDGGNGNNGNGNGNNGNGNGNNGNGNGNGNNGNGNGNGGSTGSTDQGGVTTGNWILYGNPDFNPEETETLRDHIVLLEDDGENLIVFGFEDIRRDYASCDNDFNDAIFYVTANPITAIQTESINSITKVAEDVDGGNDSGLESNGDLASKIAKRNFQRTKTERINYNNTKALQPFDAKTKQQKLGIASATNTKSNSDLIDFIPTHPFENVEAYITTPEDLLGITNAQEVFAVDYFNEDTRMAAMLATSTEGSVYDHTKAICDRLNGGSLDNIRFAYVNGKAFILSTIRKPNGKLEYAISFSVYTNNEGQRVVENHWVIEQYPTGANYQNFQVWSTAPHYTQKIIGDILAAMGQENEVVYANIAPALPAVFVQNGYYQNGTLHLSIRNTNQATSLILKGNKTVTETSERIDFEETVTLSGDEYQTLLIETGGIFDLGFSLQNNHSAQIDVLYTADAPWGLDYVAEGVDITNYEVLAHTPTDVIEEKTLVLERGINLEGSVKNYISVFKMLKTANQSLDLSAFNALQFAASGRGTVEITLTKAGIEAWADQFRTHIELTETTSDYELAFTGFQNANGAILEDVTDVVSVVFSVKGNGTDFEDFALNISNLQFSDVFSTSIEETELTAIQQSLQIYPNPFENQATIRFNMPEASNVWMQIFNMNGQMVHQQNTTAFAGENQLTFNGNRLASGMYLCVVQFEGGQVQAKMIVK